MDRALSPIPEPCHQILLRPVGFDAVAVPAQRPQVFGVVGASATLRDDVIDGEIAEGDLAAATVAPAFLLGEPDTLNPS